MASPDGHGPAAGGVRMDAARSAFATWVLWGMAAAILGLANLAVMGYDPVPRQHAVVGTAMVFVPLVGGVAMQALWPRAPAWTWLASAIGAAMLFLLASVVQSALGEAFLYGWGEGSSAEAPFALAAAFWSAALTVVARRIAWIPGTVATALLAGLYLWASSWNWGGVGAELWGGAVLNAAVVLVFTGAGAWTWVKASRSPE